MKSKTFKKASKKIFNEDLVEIGDPSEDEEQTTIQLNEPQRSIRPKHESLIISKKNSSFPIRNHNAINKLEALKFKMSL